MNASIRCQPLHGAYVQENGIIRMADGRFLGRLDGIEFEEVVERSAAQTKADEQERERLREALRPFAALADVIPDANPPYGKLALEFVTQGKHDLHTRDLHQAKRVLNGEPSRYEWALRCIFKRYNDLARDGNPPLDRAQGLAWAMASDAKIALGEEWPVYEHSTPPPASTAPPADR